MAVASPNGLPMYGKESSPGSGSSGSGGKQRIVVLGSGARLGGHIGWYACHLHIVDAAFLKTETMACCTRSCHSYADGRS